MKAKYCGNCGCKKSLHKWDTGKCINCPNNCKGWIERLVCEVTGCGENVAVFVQDDVFDRFGLCKRSKIRMQQFALDNNLKFKVIEQRGGF